MFILKIIKYFTYILTWSKLICFIINGHEFFFIKKDFVFQLVIFHLNIIAYFCFGQTFVPFFLM